MQGSVEGFVRCLCWSPCGGEKGDCLQSTGKDKAKRKLRKKQRKVDLQSQSKRWGLQGNMWCVCDCGKER